MSLRSQRRNRRHYWSREPGLTLCGIATLYVVMAQTADSVTCVRCRKRMVL